MMTNGGNYWKSQEIIVLSLDSFISKIVSSLTLLSLFKEELRRKEHFLFEYREFSMV